MLHEDAEKSHVDLHHTVSLKMKLASCYLSTRLWHSCPVEIWQWRLCRSRRDPQTMGFTHCLDPSYVAKDRARQLNRYIKGFERYMRRILIIHGFRGSTSLSRFQFLTLGDNVCTAKRLSRSMLGKWPIPNQNRGSNRRGWPTCKYSMVKQA